jgi:imidazolonepropionase-like amidohydrolase
MNNCPICQVNGEVNCHEHRYSTSTTPTPQTDAVVGQREYGSLADSEYVRLARKLEQERDALKVEVQLQASAKETAMLNYEACHALNVKLRKERNAYREKAKALDWLNTVSGMDWFSNCDYGEATLSAIKQAMREEKQ